MRHLIPLLLASVLPLAAEDLGTLVFSDDFARNESQEQTDDPGNGWATNSKARAKNNKQVDLIDGAMRIYMHAEADHAVSVTHPFDFTNGSVSLRFKLNDAKDSVGLDFADLEFKEVHAGHLCVARVSAKDIQLTDYKTGVMALDRFEARKAGTPASKEEQALLKTKSKSFPQSIALGEWHELTITISADTMSARLDGKDVGSFSSPGFAHPTKRLLRVAVPTQVLIDDVKLYRKQ